VTWSSASLATRCKREVFRRLVRWRLLGLARVLLAFVVGYYTLLPGVRRRCAPYLKRRFPEAGPAMRLLHAHRCFRAFGNALLTCLAAAATGNAPAIGLARTSALEDALAGGHGCILLSAHTGPWQLWLSGSDLEGRAVHVLEHRDPADVDRAFLAPNAAPNVHPVDAADAAVALATLAGALRRGEIICLMGDRIPGDGAVAMRTVRVPFLGEDIAVPILPYALASITQAPIVVALTATAGDGPRLAHVEAMAVPEGLDRRRPEDFGPYAAAFVRALEAFVEARPYEFFDFYDLWAMPSAGR
jgi:predicted LPLAT superfamily acyltransferase